MSLKLPDPGRISNDVPKKIGWSACFSNIHTKIGTIQRSLSKLDEDHWVTISTCCLSGNYKSLDQRESFIAKRDPIQTNGTDVPRQNYGTWSWKDFILPYPDLGSLQKCDQACDLPDLAWSVNVHLTTIGILILIILIPSHKLTSPSSSI